MKKVFFVLAFALVSAGVFAQIKILSDDLPDYFNFEVNNSDGRYIVFTHYEGMYCGQQTINETLNWDSIARGLTGESADTSGMGKALTKAQWDIVRYALDHWAHPVGYTFLISLFLFSDDDRHISSTHVAVEFTSATQYKYWTNGKDRQS